jgi:hypothetical protein
METRKIKIDITTAQRWAEGTDNELKELALQTFPELRKKQLPKSWEELNEIKGYYVSEGSEIKFAQKYTKYSEHYNVFKTENQAKSSIAMAKLSQVMAVYNGDWVADWENPNEMKYCIQSKSNAINISYFQITKHFLAFKDRETAEEFLNNFRDDIETYFNY